MIIEIYSFNNSSLSKKRAKIFASSELTSYLCRVAGLVSTNLVYTKLLGTCNLRNLIPDSQVK